MSTDGELCYSAGADTEIRMWQVPTNLSDPYDTYGQYPTTFLFL